MVTVTGGFDYTGTDNNFGRDVYETLALMKAVKAAKMPQMAFALCREDGKLYIYNKANEADDTLGKWRPAFTEGSGSSTAKTPVVLTAAEYEALDPKDPETIYLIKEA